MLVLFPTNNLWVLPFLQLLFVFFTLVQPNSVVADETSKVAECPKEDEQITHSHSFLQVGTGKIASKPLTIKEEPEVDVNFFQSRTDLMTEMQQRGATVHPSLEFGQFAHGEVSVRGIYTKEEMASTTILKMPRNLFIKSNDIYSNLAEDNSFFDCSVCAKVADKSLLEITLMLHLENLKGTHSPWHRYLAHQPTLEDYKSFMMHFAEPDLLVDFAGLTDFMKAYRLFRHEFEKQIECLVALRNRSSLLKELSRDAIMRWMLVGKTRRYKDLAGGGSALIPIADFFNTGLDTEINTDYFIDEHTFTLKATADPGAELLDRYCSSCSNQELVLIWGIFLEGNTNKDHCFFHGSCADCNRLHNPTAATLNFTAGGNIQGNVPPPCTVADGKRCNLARLAWAICVKEWEGVPEDKPVQLISMDADTSKAAAALQSYVAAFEQAAIGSTCPSAAAV